MVLRAAAPDQPGAALALGDLCQAYWYPLYAYARRRGLGPSEAEDAVQSFFAWLLEKNIIRYADPERGRFRGFLAASFQQFLARRREHESAAKRRPSGSMVSIEAEMTEGRYVRELVDDVTPDRLYDYAWAMSVLKRAMDRLRTECDSNSRAARFEAFQGLMTGQSAQSAREVGQILGMSEGAVRVALHRFKQRYGELLREEVAQTLETEADSEIESELGRLLEALKIQRGV